MSLSELLYLPRTLLVVHPQEFCVASGHCVKEGECQPSTDRPSGRAMPTTQCGPGQVSMQEIKSNQNNRRIFSIFCAQVCINV